MSMDIHTHYALSSFGSFFESNSIRSNQDLMNRHVSVQPRRSETASHVRPREDTDITSFRQILVSEALLGFALVVPSLSRKTE